MNDSRSPKWRGWTGGPVVFRQRSNSFPTSMLHPRPALRLVPMLLPFLIAASFASAAHAYTWAFKSPPQQCGNLTIQISGQGTPPYRVLIIPFGPSPLPGVIEARTILDVPFEGNSTEVTFQLKYPASSQLVAVVSDAVSFGSGGTSAAAEVTPSKDDTCFSKDASVAPAFVFNIFPLYQIVQCTNTRIWWDNSTVKSIPTFQGVIPGGQSFAIPQGQITNVPEQGTGFTWKANLRGGTTLLIVGGDSRGNGTGGSVPNTVSTDINNDGSCLSENSPSSTPGSPAGGSYPTAPVQGGGNGGGGNGSKANIGAIVGGVLGGLAFLIALILIIWFFRRKSNKKKTTKERPMNLITEDDDGDESPAAAAGGRRNELPQYYQPEPFMVPDPTLDAGRSSMGGTQADEEGRPLSGTSGSFYTRGTTPEPGASLHGYGAGNTQPGSSTGGERRKGGAPRALRPVNIIQHDDAGPSEPKEPEAAPETIELPPAYTAVGRGRANNAADPTPPLDQAAAA